MFKVFNHCLTTRTSGHDQTKVNILQLFHDVVNYTNVDYAALLWWDFMNCVFQKKDVIQYPQFTKLIIADLMKKNVLFRWMLIPDAILTEEIRATDDYKEYEIGKKRKQSAGEASSLRQSFKVTIRQKKHSTTLIPPPSDDKERDEIAETTLLSLTLHKTALAAEAQENVAKVQEKLADEEIEKMVEGEEDEESYASMFVDFVLNDDDDSGTKIKPESHKENPKVVNDDDDVNVIEKKDDEKNDEGAKKMDEVVKEKNNGATDSQETRNEQMHIPIPTPNRSPRKDLSSDKTISEELTAKIREVLDHCNNVVSEMTFAKRNEMIKEEMPRLVNLAVNKDREIVPKNIPELIAKEFATNGPKMIKELFRKHMQNTTLNLYPTTISSTARKSTADLQHQLYLNMNSKPQDQAADPELWEILKVKFEKP
ncbi:hypothetical protein Tco_0797409 [Tanacetum coccineum]